MYWKLHKMSTVHHTKTLLCNFRPIWNHKRLLLILKRPNNLKIKKTLWNERTQQLRSFFRWWHRWSRLARERNKTCGLLRLTKTTRTSFSSSYLSKAVVNSAIVHQLFSVGFTRLCCLKISTRQVICVCSEAARKSNLTICWLSTRWSLKYFGIERTWYRLFT